MVLIKIKNFSFCAVQLEAYIDNLTPLYITYLDDPLNHSVTSYLKGDYLRL